MPKPNQVLIQQGQDLVTFVTGRAVVVAVGFEGPIPVETMLIANSLRAGASVVQVISENMNIGEIEEVLTDKIYPLALGDEVFHISRQDGYIKVEYARNDPD